MATIVGILAIAGIADAQQADANQSVRRVRAALDVATPPLRTPSLPPWQEPTIKRFGAVTLLPPDTNGQFVRAVVPIGELAARAGHAIAVARHRRAERDAHEKVVLTLKDYMAQR
jgi:hypothetical protein